MELLAVLGFCFCLTFAVGSKCSNVSGRWQNELGSRMFLTVDAANHITGEYWTAVERRPGDAAFVSNITGLVSSQKDGSLIAFSVLFNHGASLATWVGQCTVCDNKEELYTTFIHRKYASNLSEKWSATTVNRNNFWRVEDENYVEDVFPSPAISHLVSSEHTGGDEISGKWKTDTDEEIEIKGMQDGLLEGTYLSSDLTGRKCGNGRFTALSLMSASNKVIRGWAGHTYIESSEVQNILETSWLEHEFNPSCAAPRQNVRFGTQNFNRLKTEQDHTVLKSETFLDKIRKFFTSMF